MTLDLDGTGPRNVHFQCTLRASSHGLRMVASTYAWRKRQADERYRRWKEDYDRRRRRREERAKERKEKEEKAKMGDPG